MTNTNADTTVVETVATEVTDTSVPVDTAPVVEPIKQAAAPVVATVVDAGKQTVSAVENTTHKTIEVLKKPKKWFKF